MLDNEAAPRSIEIPQGRGSGLDADKLGGRPSSLFHSADNHAFMKALSDPQAPTMGSKFYTRLNSSGKHELVVLFPTGAVQVIATQA